VQALDLLPRGGRRWFLAAGEAVEAAARLGDENDLHRSVDELCDVSSAGQLTAPHLVALTRAACVLMQAGNYPSADDLLRTIDAAYEHSRKQDEDPLAVAHVYRTRAYRAHVGGDAASALSLYNVAISNFEQAGDTRAACRYLVSAAAACLELGAYQDSERALADALASAERMGLSGVTASSWHHLGMLLARKGDTRGAISREDAAIEAFKAQGDRRMEGAARLYRALFLSMDAELEVAERETLAALDTAGLTPPLRAYGLAVLGRIRLTGSTPERAEDAAREAIEVLDALGGIEEGESYVRLTFAEALEASGSHDAACDAIATARVRILERAAMIHDPAWKDSFLTRVRENARTIELAKQWRVV
jgi:tetratricopeptide (TPR) repeat protein